MMTSSNSPVIIYISAASDLMPERETLARLIAGLPVTLAWHVVQTPLSESEAFDTEALRLADLHLLLMGSDIRAPVGLELHLVRRAGRHSFAFLKRGVPRTPAGQVFIQDAGVTWRAFSDMAELRRQIQSILAEHLVGHAGRYALTPAEIDALKADLAADASDTHAPRGQEAGHSAVILSRERFEPRQGTLVDGP